MRKTEHTQLIDGYALPVIDSFGEIFTNAETFTSAHCDAPRVECREQDGTFSIWRKAQTLGWDRISLDFDTERAAWEDSANWCIAKNDDLNVDNEKSLLDVLADCYDEEKPYFQAKLDALKAAGVEL